MQQVRRAQLESPTDSGAERFPQESKPGALEEDMKVREIGWSEVSEGGVGGMVMELSVGLDEVEGGGEEGRDSGGEGSGDGVQQQHGMVLAGLPQHPFSRLVCRDKHPRKRAIPEHRGNIAPPQPPHPGRPDNRFERLSDAPVVIQVRLDSLAPPTKTSVLS